MDLVASVTGVVNIALQIQELVETVHQNKDDCKKIATRVERLRAIVQCLHDTDVSSTKPMIDALNELEETFRRALKLVKACQAKNIVCLFLRAGNVSKQLREVKDEIMEHMHIANFSNGVQQTVMYTRAYITNPAAMPKKLLKVQSMKGEQEISVVGSHLVRQDTEIWVDEDATGVEDAHASYSTNDTRSEVRDEQEGLPAGSLEYNISRFKNFSLSELKASTKDLSNDHVIGRGGFVTVYKGVLTNGAEVAIKMFIAGRGQDDGLARYAEVFSVIGEHENVVRFLGYCHEMKIEFMRWEDKCVPAETHHMFVVEEYMANGSLSNIIHGSSWQLDWTSTFRIIRGIAQGVAHIHTKGTVHLDLKPDNILLDSNMNPKICDFGLSKILNQDDELGGEGVTRELVGTMGYFPPEYIADGIFSFKYDVYSFGIILVKTISMSGLLQDSTDWVQYAQEGLDDVEDLLAPSLHDEPELKEIKRCMKIGVQCAAKERIDRPTMGDVVDMLDGNKQLQRTPMRNKASSFKKKGKA
ncbi:hypothetical protein CFC21_054845 [Triticum aestivum]|uniref:non-specific serine/threonine protein kinase n=3 Tax=Triticum TaxID=4564 RepID=A0A9R0W430_TRITD|nr:hypothetical protein CFC21_054845 [Triticum aestivum]VAH98006.1 unnamed protein product [Triticum turgidum subsp. durum]